jgi:tRNA pseudouridine32 synthase / 23S rRNA pseudouridine746 synthase
VNTAELVARIESTFSSIYHCWNFYKSTDISGDLISTLASRLTHIPESEFSKRLAWGGVFINGLEVNTNQELPVPCKLEYYEPRFKIENAEDFFPVFSKDLILFEDQYLIAVFKPAGLPTLPGKEQKYFNLRSYIEKYTGGKVHMPSRLDMSTSGVVIISKNEKTHKSLQRLFENGLVQKTYLLAVTDTVDWQRFEHTGAIGNDLRHPVLRKVVQSGGKQAKTIFTKLIETNQQEIKICYLKAEPKTGRTHQIRVHASSLGLPIVGDNFYGGIQAKNLNLMAYSIEFRHPIGGEIIKISAPEKLWPTWLAKEIAPELVPML